MPVGRRLCVKADFEMIGRTLVKDMRFSDPKAGFEAQLVLYACSGAKASDSVLAKYEELGSRQLGHHGNTLIAFACINKLEPTIKFLLELRLIGKGQYFVDLVIDGRHVKTKIINI